MSGFNNTEAYRQIFDTAGQADSTVYGNANALAKNPLIVAKLDELRLKAEQQATLAPTLGRSFVLNGIMALALSSDKDSVKLRAYELLGKTAGIDLFRDTVIHTKDERTIEDVDRELRAKLKDLQVTLDLEPNSVSTSPADRRRKPKS